MTFSDIESKGYDDYPAYRNPYVGGTSSWVAYDLGYWAAHDESFVEESGGIEEGYGDFYDAHAAQWDDDPNPYLGTYSEE